MQVRDEKLKWTDDAKYISDKIRDAIYPIFEECVRSGMSYEGFHYLVCT